MISINGFSNSWLRCQIFRFLDWPASRAYGGLDPAKRNNAFITPYISPRRDEMCVYNLAHKDGSCPSRRTHTTLNSVKMVVFFQDQGAHKDLWHRNVSLPIPMDLAPQFCKISRVNKVTRRLSKYASFEFCFIPHFSYVFFLQAGSPTGQI